jgi:large repetitive protein
MAPWLLLAVTMPSHLRPSWLVTLSIAALVGCVEPSADELEQITDHVAAPRFREQAGGIADQYIVVLKEPAGLAASDPTVTHASIDRLTRAHRATELARYTSALRGFAATLGEADARALAEDPEVAYVQPNIRNHGGTVQSNATWGLDRIDQAALPLDKKYIYPNDGAGVTVYMLDSGIRATHIEFTGRLIPGFTAINDGQGTNDCNQHGTHTSGTVGGKILGAAKGVTIVPVRVLDCANAGSSLTVIAGIEWILANKRPVSVANISIGGPIDAAEDQAVQNLINAGVTVVVSAGNNNADACTQSPAHLPAAITVAASDMNDVRATFSNFGTCVDLFAPGVDIVSASVAGDTLSRKLSGTSMSAPHVAGLVAIYRATHPAATQAEVAAAVLARATPGKIVDAKSPNLLLNTAFLDTIAPVTAITAPVDGATVDPTFTVAASVVEDNLAKVELVVDGQVAGTGTAAPFTFQLAGVAAGVHTITVQATDAYAQMSSTTIRVTVRGAEPPPDDDDDPEPAPAEGGCSSSSGGGGSLACVAFAGAFVLRRRPRRDRQPG